MKKHSEVDFFGFEFILQLIADHEKLSRDGFYFPSVNMIESIYDNVIQPHINNKINEEMQSEEIS